MRTPHDRFLFDLDGTISDPRVGIGRSLNHALAHFGYATVPLEECSPYIGPPLDESFASLTGSRSKGHIAELVARYRERYAEVGYAENELYPGIPEALRGLAGSGRPLALCTSKRADFAERILELFGLRELFDFVSGGEIGVQKWQQVAELARHGRVTTATVMIGDRKYDMQAAHRNGLPAAGVLWGHGSRDELEADAPRYLLRVPSELATLAAVPQ